MKHTELSWDDVKCNVQEILRQIANSDWRPDYIVGLTRGGLIPATMISHYLDCRLHTLNVSLRDADVGPESNLWMSEDAFGYVPAEEQSTYKSRWDIARRKKILIVDDINDSGATLTWIKNDWQTSCLPSEQTWNTVWNNNVRVATLYTNTSSESQLKVDYASIVIDKKVNPEWIVFPWEQWWKI